MDIANLAARVGVALFDVCLLLVPMHCSEWLTGGDLRTRKVDLQVWR